MLENIPPALRQRFDSSMSTPITWVPGNVPTQRSLSLPDIGAQQHPATTDQEETAAAEVRRGAESKGRTQDQFARS